MPLHVHPGTGPNIYPDYLRAKTGVAAVYAHMLFPKEDNPRLEMFIESVPELCVFIFKTNDVLS